MRKIFLPIAFLFFLFLNFVSKAQTLSVYIGSTPFCNWSNTGTITANASGGTPPYSYNWSNGATGQSVINYPGTNCVTVTDANSIYVSTCNSGFNSAAHAIIRTQPEICGAGNGLAWIDSLIGTPPFNILWSDGTAGDTMQNLSAGYYTLNVGDAAGCQVFVVDGGGWWVSDSISVIISDSTTYAFNITQHPHHCPQLGSAAVHITGGGSPPFTYAWNTTPVQTTDSISGLLAGVYTVTINDASNCSVMRDVDIVNDLPITATSTSTPEVCLFNNGTATVIPQSGTPPYTYLWNCVPAQTTITAAHLSNGVYQATVLDANNCMANLYVQVGYTSPVQINLVKADEKCGNGAGSITLTPLLGTPPYVYHWSNGGSTSSITNLHHNIYSVTVDDAQHCTVAGSAYVNDVPSYNVNITYTDCSCTAPTGTATANVTGTTGPYTYTWNTSPAQHTQTASGLAMGYYSCLITDANGCSGYYSVSIPYVANVSLYLGPNTAFCNTATGSVNCFPSGGAAPYSYHWNTNATTQTISNVVSGYYYVTVTDVNGCTNQKGVYVSKYSNMQLNVSHTNATCIFDTNGTATVQVSNATPPYNYQWSTGQATQTTTGLTPNFYYSVYVVDANGCESDYYPIHVGYNNLSCAALVEGEVVKDWDKDCALTTGDEGIPNINVQAIPGYYDFTDANGNFSFILPAGNYALNHTLPYHTFQNCPVGPIVLLGLTAGNNYVNNNFYDTVRVAADLWVQHTFMGDPRPGSSHTVMVNFGNRGNITMSPVIEYDYDADETFVSSNIPSANYVHDVVNRKIYFSGYYIMNNMLPGSSSYFKLFFTTATTVALGTDISDCSHITPVVNDVNFVDNDFCRSTFVVASFDPNDKKVFPKGLGAEGFITREDSFLHYTIRFQNTGTAYAYNVLILDSLDTDVDPGSVERIVASHNVRPDFFQNKTLAFYFDNISLPDSITNEEASHGFVSFYVKQKPNLANGTQIKNHAAIYFDYNLPVITNTVLNTIQAPNAVEEILTANLKLYPNPTTDLLNVEFENTQSGKMNLEIENLLGQKVISKTIDVTDGKNLIQLSVKDFVDGFYLLNLQNGERKYAVKKFMIAK